MKQRIKRIFLTLFICFNVFLLMPASARAEIKDEERAAVQQMAEQNLQAIVSFDDATIEQYILQFETQGNVVLSNGLKSWLALKKEAGAFVDSKEISVRETEEGLIAEVKITCENRDAVLNIGFDRKTGSVIQMSFYKTETLSEKLKDAAFNLLIGMGTVFLVLIFIAFIISRFKVINDWVNAKERRKKEEADYLAEQVAAKRMPAVSRDVSKRISPERVRSAVIPNGTTVEKLPCAADAVGSFNETDPQLIAVLTAAIMAGAGEDSGPDGLIVRSVRRVSLRTSGR